MLMLFILFYSLMGISFFIVLIKNKLNTLFYLPVFWIIEEMLSTYFYRFDSNGTINALTFLFILYALFKFGLFKIMFWNVFLLLFLFISVIKTPFADDYLSFGNRYINLLNIYMILPISYYTFKNMNDYKKIKNVFNVIIILVVLYLVISSLLKVGPNMYETGIVYGLNWGQFYGPAIIASIVFVSNRGIKSLSIRNLILYALILLIFLTMRRTAILIIVLFVSFYYLFKFERKISIYLMFFVSIASLAASTLYLNANISKSSRADKFTKDYDITEEGRYNDIYGVLTIMKSENAILSGYELFNDAGNYGSKRSSRPIHVDIMRLFYGIGLVGVLPLIIFILTIGFKVFMIKNREVKAMGVALIAVFVLTLFTGGTFYISYSGVVFINLGMVLKLSKIKI